LKPFLDSLNTARHKSIQTVKRLQMQLSSWVPTNKALIYDTMNKKIMFKFRKKGCVLNIMTNWDIYKDKPTLKHETTMS
jgi:hypothetical protein